MVTGSEKSPLSDSGVRFANGGGFIVIMSAPNYRAFSCQIFIKMRQDLNGPLLGDFWKNWLTKNHLLVDHAC